MFHASYNGVLFIGDPHVSSKAVGRRKDDYLTSTLTKLEACAQRCKEFNLFPIILGDLFHTYDDNDLEMLYRLISVLKKFPAVPLVVEGNHDKGMTHLSPKDALSLLILTGVAMVPQVEAEVGILEIKGNLVRIWACPYGAPVPPELPGYAGRTIMLTHHDLAFGSAYPGAMPLHPVKNCDMAVNGHMHGTKPSEKHGDTWWHNPGNIEPLSIADLDHLPRAWEWTPENLPGSLTGHNLPHGEDVFDLTGLHVKAATADESVLAYTTKLPNVVPDSSFAKMLQSRTSEDAEKTDDASVLQEDLALVLEETGASEATVALLNALMTSVQKTSLAS